MHSHTLIFESPDCVNGPSVELCMLFRGITPANSDHIIVNSCGDNFRCGELVFIDVIEVPKVWSASKDLERKWHVGGFDARIQKLAVELEVERVIPVRLELIWVHVRQPIPLCNSVRMHGI